MMTALKKHSAVVPYLYIIVGTALMGISTQCIYDPAGLVTGGFTGIAIVVKELTGMIYPGGIPLWFTNLILNVPVFLIAYLRLGKKFVGRTLFGTVMLSAWLYILPAIDIPQGDYLLAAVFGGIFSGSGMGLVLRGKATTGGTDMVAALIQCRARHYSVVQIMQFVDGVVVLLGFFVFGIRPTLYAIVAIFVATKVGDTVLEGLNYSKAAFIITDRYEQVANVLMEDLDRGATGLMAKGMYTGDAKCVLYCVVSRKQIVTLKEMVAEIDPNAFVIVSDVREVLGEGFQENIISDK
jgi:uncharacterized membrane-anchored protein YitT (DUF2179 family)